ncbi:YibE/F family protein [Agromyces seonyuensis]|uniref:YibE/F family protein n=1 Tax=Agromyces seonyuensis TaxID=2662446 RepID=A0A6I4P1K1_9MICO|nr:YibE/F family protein [Agromyces seonyuensis]MWB96994.1 YibE/F family protein [Agromyces seonyuensis]
MVDAHSHAHGGSPTRLRVQGWPKVLILGLIALCGIAAVAGIVAWWPDSDRVDEVRGLVPFAVEGLEVVHGELVEVQPACTGAETETEAVECGPSQVEVLDGPNAGSTVPITLAPSVAATGLSPGDRVLLFDATAVQQSDEAEAISFYRADRGGSMLWLTILFVVAVVLVAWRRGVLALISLGFAGLVVLGYLIPALLSGQPPILVTLAASTVILIVMLYVTHGISMRTSVALAGALIGVGLSTVFAWYGVIGSRLGGLGDEAAGLLLFNVPWIHIQQLVVASVILAGLGTLNDVTVTQASALWELRAASATMTRWELFRSAMRIGRDHVASTVYTLVFAYLGTALVLIVAVQLYGGTAADFITSEDVAAEIVRALVGGLALVLAMPITTALGTLVVAGAGVDEPPAPDPDPEPAPGPRRRSSAPTRSSDEFRHLPEY